MAVMTLTEFHQHSSRATRIAEGGEEVVITRRGRPCLKLVPAALAETPIERGLREGWITPPKGPIGPWPPSVATDPAEARELIEWFEASRDVDNY